MKENAKDVAIRAVKTFWQTAIASFIFAIPQITESLHDGWEVLKPVLVSAGIGALAAGLSATYNGVLKPLAEKLKAKNTSVE